MKPQLDKESDPLALSAIKDRLFVYLQSEDSDSILALAIEHGFQPDYLDAAQTRLKAKDKGTPGLTCFQSGDLYFASSAR